MLAVNKADLQDRWALQCGDEAAQAKEWDIRAHQRQDRRGRGGGVPPDRAGDLRGEGGEAMTVAEETTVRVDGGTDNVTTVVARA